MSFYFCGKSYILIVMKKKWNEICMQLPYIFENLMIILGMKSEKAILKLSSVILFYNWAEVLLCPNEAGWTDLLVVERHLYRRSMLVCLIRPSSYSVCSTPYYASEVDCKEPNIEPESRSFADICTELLDEIRKLAANQTAMVDANLEPDVVD